MKVSVIIPVYDQEKYLKECLDSVIHQTLQEIEIICVDDHSTDHSAEILAEYRKRDNRIRLVYNKENRGLSYTRNRGLAVARGKYVCFLDADDMYVQLALEELYCEAEKYQADVVFFSSKMKVESDRVTEKETAYCTNGEYPGVMTGKQFLQKMQETNDVRFPACLQFWNRDSFGSLSMGFLEGVIHEDILFTYLGLVRTQRVICVKKQYYIYRRHDGSITLKKADRTYIKSLLRIYHEIMVYWHDHMESGIDGITRRYLEAVKWTIKKYALETGEDEDTLREAWGIDSFYSHWYFLIMASRIRLRNGYQTDAEKLVQMVKADKLYIYGAGKVAEGFILSLRGLGIDIEGVIVTDKKDDPSVFLGLPVFNAEEISEYRDTCTVLIGVGKKLRAEVIGHLQSMGFQDYIEI